MKVLHLSSEDSWRGGEQQIAYLIEESVKNGVAVIVLAKEKSPFVEWCASHDVSCDTSSFKNGFDLTTARALKRLVTEHAPDIIHAHGSRGHSIAALANAMGVSTDIVLSRRVDFPIKSNAWAKWKYNLSSIKRIVCVSDAIADMVRAGVKNSAQVCTVHSGIDFQRFGAAKNTGILRATYNIAPDELIIANVSAIAPHKDLFTFIDTCALLKERGLKARYLIIGDGPEREAIEQYRKEKQMEHELVFTGFMDNIPAILPEVDVFLMTSKTEGLGTTILDAFACKVPVVATAAGGIPESVIDGQTGLLCAIGDSNALAENVMRITRDEQLKSTLVEGATAHLQSFTKEAMAEKTMAIYAEIFGRA